MEEFPELLKIKHTIDLEMFAAHIYVILTSPNSSQMHACMPLNLLATCLIYSLSNYLSITSKRSLRDISQFYCHAIIVHLSGNENMTATARQKIDLLIVGCLLEGKKQESMSS
jgi:hypothetical protein